MTIASSKGRTRPGNIFIRIILILCSLLIIYPFLYLLAVSFSSKLPILQNRVWLYPIGFNLTAYSKVFQVKNFLRSYGNTILYTVVGTSISLIMTTLTAYPLSKPYLKGRKFFNFMIMFTMMFGGGLIANYILIKSLHMINTIWAIVIPGAVSAWNMVLMRTYFEQLPESLEESAKLDGANDFQILYKIVLPTSTPIISTMVLYYAVGQWNSWFAPFIYLSDADKFPLQLFVRGIVLTGEMNVMQQIANGGEVVLANSLKYAIIMISMIPMLILYPLIQRYLVKGIMVGAIKG